MAVVNTKAAALTSADATSQTLVSPKVMGAPLRIATGTAELANGDSIASTIRLCRVPSRARVHRVLIGCDAITSGAADVGVYRVAADGGAVVDADLFASAQSIASAIVINTDITHESGVYGVEDVEKPLWEAAGLSADPQCWFDVVATLTAAAAAAGTLTLHVVYADM